jgi:FkbM family methyltransferase
MHKFYGQFEPPVDRFIYERYFRDEGIKGVFVECGAFDGLTENSCRFFEETLGWKGFNIEPVPWVYEKLCNNRPDTTNLNFALSDKVGTSTFTAVDHPVFGVDCTNGSLAHTAKHLSMLEADGCHFIEVPVRLLTWSEFVIQNGIKHVDLLVLDVEGHEVSVIEGMQDCSVLPDIFCIEIGHLDFFEIRSRLEKLGYVYDVSSHVNAFFIKRDLTSLFLFRLNHFKGVRLQIAEELTSVLEGTSAEVPHHEETVATLVAQKNSLLEELDSVRAHLHELTDLYNNIVTSKTWKIVERIRSFRR